MKKFKFFIDQDKEEKWLNHMANQGYELKKVSFGYEFHIAKPEDAKIRIDYRTFKNEEDFIDYCTLFEDSGWKHIAGNKYSGSQYFKKIDKNSDDDIFSDAISKAGKYKRLSNGWMIAAISYLPILSVLVWNKYIDINAFTNLKLLYYTPGLWQMSGEEFWRHFLFETPFATLRGFLWLLFPIAIILYSSFSIKAQMLYNKQKKTNELL
ncbi:DUF2812 domain-containing protein [Clostridium lundense]|uniref:DUF2812 domain-containing protein n=1 Tax=Clostridium lundense TaxID=319475 RepID=UPI000484C384|nr:DUF2812 domain-containing protein [Clostridium lundense]